MTNTLSHGHVRHGAQVLHRNREFRRFPLLYYFNTGPIGQLFQALHQDDRANQVGIVGLGVGTLAVYAEPGQEFTFFEIDPAVARLARDENYFTLLRDCLGICKVVIGDARLSLAQEPDGRFGILILDAFSGDAIPVHLLTREALALYVQKIQPHGVIAIHFSNSYLDLGPILARLAEAEGLAAYVQVEEHVSQEELRQGKLASAWAVMAREPADLELCLGSGPWRRLRASKAAPLWTDDYSNILSVLRWR